MPLKRFNQEGDYCEFFGGEITNTFGASLGVEVFVKFSKFGGNCLVLDFFLTNICLVKLIGGVN